MILQREHDWATKVPAVPLGSWIIKVLATTRGETGGDTVSMTLDLGYLVGTALSAFATRPLGIGYTGGPALLLGCRHRTEAGYTLTAEPGRPS